MRIFLMTFAAALCSMIGAAQAMSPKKWVKYKDLSTASLSPISMPETTEKTAASSATGVTGILPDFVLHGSISIRAQERKETAILSPITLASFQLFEPLRYVPLDAQSEKWQNRIEKNKSDRFDRVLIPREEKTVLIQPKRSHNKMHSILARLSGPKIIAGKTIHAPKAFSKFCKTYRELCDTSRDKVIRLTISALAKIKRLNMATNSSIRPKQDQKGKDQWQAFVTQGDCEDYALTKRAKLIQMGFPASALRMAVAYTPKGEGHAVLVITTDKGDLVLDNRNNNIVNFAQTDLRWLKIQSLNNPLIWHRI
ncbi:MAG: transglutaminase-like cysteine peptidase [Cohaesibacter sp.]|nr:transglutaminase-like cysteine peptidase [Cohaesibacter sp.]